MPRTYLRLQCEHELRGKHIQLRQTYLLHRSDGAVLARMLRASASGFATLFRTLLRLRGEPLPAEPARVIQRVADLYQLDAQGLLSAHLFRYSTRRYKADEVLRALPPVPGGGGAPDRRARRDEPSERHPLRRPRPAPGRGAAPRAGGRVVRGRTGGRRQRPGRPRAAGAPPPQRRTPPPATPATPRPVGFVNDRAGTLDETSRARLEAFLDQVKRKTGVQFAVLTLRTTAPLDPIQYKTEAYQRWFHGNRTSLLLLVALEERKIAFETGYELEGILPDGLEARIIRDEMTPRFRAGDFAGGITAGVLRVVERHREGPRGDARVGRPRTALLGRAPRRRGLPAGDRGLRRGDGAARDDPARPRRRAPRARQRLVGGPRLVRRLRRGLRRRRGGSGGGFGGFGGGGGFGSGGGGGSGGW